MTTPIRRQYLHIKDQYPDAIVLFRLGDFYETFEGDAEIVAHELQIVLTSRSMGKGQQFPMAGIPHHALDSYLARLIRAGHRVAICEQIGDPKAAKGLVERDVVRVITPGTVVEPNLLDTKSNNYLASIVAEDERAGIAYVDITTGEFAVTQVSLDRAAAEMERLSPSEIIVPHEFDAVALPVGPAVIDQRWFEVETARQTLLDYFEVASLEGYGCERSPLAIGAAGAIVHYLKETQKGSFAPLPKLSTYSTDTFMVLDSQTRRNLELFASSSTGTIAGSLLSVIDLTKTPMGGRQLKLWLGQPLLDIKPLRQRQEAVAWLVDKSIRRLKLVEALSRLADLERLINRVCSGIAIPREVVSLRRSLETVPPIKALLEGEGSPLSWLASEMSPCTEVVDLISSAVVEEPSTSLGEGGVIKPGFSPELDQIRSASRNAKQYLADLESKERRRTDIKSLKVGYNRVFGYYIEVTAAHLGKAPEDYIRKQTLTGAERFITPELKEYEALILNAQERVSELETNLFRQVCRQVAGSASRILSTAHALGQVDVLAALAEVAVRHSYVRPELDEGNTIRIIGGRHPVVEQILEETSFVPNDTHLSNENAQLMILTGPNMAGKSTYLRQVALIVLMAQIGSFVPAESASVGLADRIFTRVGLMDDLTTGRSTFMIEMTEAANILNNATPKSLIILDEIGRGTSTYDGLSIAQAVVEYIHNHPRLGAKTIFATHYHEMVALAQVLPRVRNFNVAVLEEDGKVAFLRKVIPGGSDRSYGIHVAQLAGMPRSVLHRATEVLAGLENGKDAAEKRRKAKPGITPQLSLFGEPSPLIDEIQKIDVDSMTPLEAINKLYELKTKASG